MIYYETNWIFDLITEKIEYIPTIFISKINTYFVVNPEGVELECIFQAIPPERVFDNEKKAIEYAIKYLSERLEYLKKDLDKNPNNTHLSEHLETMSKSKQELNERLKEI